MDITSQSIPYKVKKVLRYVTLYGMATTVAKVKAQYHMKRSFDELPPLPDPPPSGGEVGLIGCGNFAFSTIAHHLTRNFGPVLRAAMDTDVNKSASLYQQYGLRYYTDNADRIINDPQIKLVYVASNHATHAEYAIQALQAGKSVHIEKPHVVDSSQLLRLCRAMRGSAGRVGLGFNRPQSRLYRLLKEALEGQGGPLMLNWFIAGHTLPADHWYYRPGEGGRVLGNLCHWTDLIYQLVPAERRFPVTINPTRAAKADCDIAVTFTFGDGSIAAITFSAKGSAFEGVRERLVAHRGDLVASMTDFQRLQLEVVDTKKLIEPLFRDHGHEANICRSYRMLGKEPGGDGCTVSYVWESALLFLKTKEALEKNEKVIVSAFDESLLSSPL